MSLTDDSPVVVPDVPASSNEARSTPALVRNSLIEEVLRTRGFNPDGWLRKGAEPVFGRSINHFLEIMTEFDRICGEQGFMAGALWMLPMFARGVEVNGAEEIPPDGPLLLLSNHPGSFDEVVLGATVPRPDIRFLANNHPLLTSLPSLSRHAVFSQTNDSHARVGALRQGIKNLRAGGMLLLFPNGRTDPDPRRIAGARESITTWSPSIELLLAKAPETRVVVSIVSGVTSSAVMRMPFMRFKRPQLERQKLAQTFQMALQLLFPRLFHLTPRITFSRTFTLEELTSAGSHGAQRGIIAVAQQMVDRHIDGAAPVKLLPLTT